VATSRPTPSQSEPSGGMDRGSRIQLWAVVLVTLLVMIAGVLVVVAPDRMGVPLAPATPVATPATSIAPED